MSKTRVGTILLLGASLALGVGLGEVNFGLFQRTMPPMAISNLNQGTAHMMFLLYGVGAGVVIFCWAMLAVFLAPLFKTPEKA